MTSESPPSQRHVRADDATPRGRTVSGTAFVVVCAALAVAFVLFLVFVSPVLLERTQALAPPRAPQTVASGQVGGTTWTATAYDGSAHLRGVDERGVEAVVDEQPCLGVTAADEELAEVCVERRGGSIRDLGSAPVGGGRVVLLGIVAPEVTTVALDVADGGELELAPSYVDYGFPLGFFAVEVDDDVRVRAARALDRDGVVRGSAACASTGSPVDGCAMTEGDY